MLYHDEIYFPALLRQALPKGSINLWYTYHAQLACNSDRYGKIDAPLRLNMDEVRVFEAEVANARLTKFVVRVQYNHTHDLCIVVGVDKTGYFVKTVWLNDKFDKHKTLKRHLYAKAKQ